MHDLIPTMTSEAIQAVRSLEYANAERPQVNIETLHTFHAGMYARTIMIPASVLITGALIKIATILIVNGDTVMYTDGGTKRLTGYHVLSASAGRKQAFVAVSDTYLTMLFPTKAKTVEEAEAEFTDETNLLLSRRIKDTICQE